VKNIRLFNTLTGQIEFLKPVSPPEVRIYSCGPTVYGHTHLGHMRAYTNVDTLIRILKYFGLRPYQVMNITDVGHILGDCDLGKDKIEEAARKEKKDAWEITREYTKEFFLMIKKLNIRKADIVSKATDNIPQMILLVQELERRGFTYKIKDGIYFDTAKISDYGKLSHMPRKKLLEGARVEVNLEKKNPADFALWKFTPKGVNRQMEWASPWNEKTFPGWHIECSTMAMRYLSNCFTKGKFHPQRFETIDIHTGGIDLIPVHHTNEIAQTEAATGKKFVNYWIHNEFLQVDGRKMSKSLGNFYTLSDLERRGYKDLMPLRYLFLNTHYRKKTNFTWQALTQADRSYQEIIRRIEIIKTIEGKYEESDQGRKKICYYLDEFNKAITNDLNMPQALAVMHEVLKDKDIIGKSQWDLLKKFDQVLGLQLKEHVDQLMKVKKKIPARISILVLDREKSRQEKDWLKSDELRVQIEKSGYSIKDTPGGSKVTPKK